MDQRIITLYDEYTHKPLTRQEFMHRLILLTGGVAAAMSILPLLEVNYANAAITKDDDLFTEHITYKGASEANMGAYVARPKKENKYTSVMVIHENRGLNAHIEDVTRRAAKAGYLAIAPNALAPLGGTPAKVGCVGFCWGGAMSNQLAVNVPSLKAAVAFYGRQPEVADVSKIKAALQLHYAGLDERINAGKDAYVDALKKNSITHEVYVYDGVNHAFHNDSAPTRYNEAAAKQAWQRTMDFFGKHLK